VKRLVARRMRWLLGALVALAGCGSSGQQADAGPDAGVDAGPPLTDGGALGAACSSLDQCAGNPICGLNQDCPIAVICAAGLCASAGGPPVALEVALSLEVSRLPSYVQLFLLAPELVKAGSLDCPGLLAGIDAGTLNPYLKTEVNPLLLTYSQSVEGASMSAPFDFPLQPTVSGMGRVLYLEGYLRSALADGGDALVGIACDSFDDTLDAGSLGVTLGPP
jgi:hypothetical protein